MAVDQIRFSVHPFSKIHDTQKHVCGNASVFCPEGASAPQAASEGFYTVQGAGGGADRHPWLGIAQTRTAQVHRRGQNRSIFTQRLQHKGWGGVQYSLAVCFAFFDNEQQPPTSFEAEHRPSLLHGEGGRFRPCEIRAIANRAVLYAATHAISFAFAPSLSGFCLSAVQRTKMVSAPSNRDGIE